MTVTYEVGGSSSNGKLDIDFYVSLPISEREPREVGGIGSSGQGH